MKHNINNYIFYDLETNGLDYYTTGILQITMLDIYGDILLNQYVYPYNRLVSGTDIHGIDEKKLIDNNAIETDELCKKFKDIIKKKYGDDIVYLIGYNNFGYDQIILENNFKLSRIQIPQNLYFIDIYPIIKEIYPKIKPNFKLSSVYENLCKKEGDKDINFHCALEDTKCLYKVYKVVKSHEKGDHYLEKYLRPLLQNRDILKMPVCVLGGYNKSIPFERKGIYTIKDLYEVYKKCDFKEDIYEMYLKNSLGIYSSYIVVNLIKQLKIIHFFLK